MVWGLSDHPHSLFITSPLSPDRNDTLLPPSLYPAMSLRAASPPPRATTPEPTFQPLPSPRLRSSRSIRQLQLLTTTTTTATTTLSSRDEFHLTFDEFGTDHRMCSVWTFPTLLDTDTTTDSPQTPTRPHRTRRKSGPASPSLQNPPRRSGSPPPPAHHHPTPPPPLPPLPPFLISAVRKSSTGCGFDIPDVSIFPSTPSTSSDESENSRCYPIHRSN